MIALPQEAVVVRLHEAYLCQVYRASATAAATAELALQSRSVMLRIPL